jgi:hypothetical protein
MRMLEKEEKVARLLCWRAYIFTCSYKTAWEIFMMDDEKLGFTYDYLVADYMVNL